MRKHLPKLKLMAPLGLFLLALTIGMSLLIKTKPSNNNQSSTPVKTQASVKTSESNSNIKLIATGDFIAHDSINNAAMKMDGSYDYMPLMKEFEPILKANDIRYCNDPILNGGKELGISGYPKFNSPTEFVRDMGRVGCNLVSTASNHSFDFTQDHIDASIDAWNKVPNMLDVSGENKNDIDKNKLNTFTIKGVKFAFFAYTTYTNKPIQNNYGVNVYSAELASRQIDEAKQNGAQFIIISMRWGTEYSSKVNAQQANYAQFLADQGVNLVLGHGPHQLQPVEKLKGKSGNETVIWYSLGNFINSQETPETLFNGLASMIINPTNLQISEMNYLPIYMHYEWTEQQAKSAQYLTRFNVHLYLLEQATQQMLDSQQLKTTIEAQKIRLQSILNAKGVNVPFISSKTLQTNN